MSAPEAVTFGQALGVWAKIGVLSFGGPAGQIALMHRILVEEQKWLSEERFLHALNFCTLLPGPEAMQLATYAGWSLHGTRGGLAAGLLFVLPGALVVLALSMLYVAFGEVPAVAAAFYGIKAAVLAIVLEALLRVARRALKLPGDWWIAAAAFAALFVFAIPFPLVVIAAGILGIWRTAPSADRTVTLNISWPRSLATIAAWLALWLVPVALLFLFAGGGHVWTDIAVFFSKLAVVSFGGAYAVLAYMAQHAVEQKHWLTAPEMVDGLGLAETTPGPLILVIEYVAYLAGYRLAGGMWGGLVGAAISLWVTFVPCFLWIFAAAPYLEALRALPKLSGALAAITAAVVGVILNLTLWFALQVLFAEVRLYEMMPVRIHLPVVSSLDWGALGLLAVAALLLFRFHLGVVATLAVCALAGMLLRLFA